MNTQNTKILNIHNKTIIKLIKNQKGNNNNNNNTTVARTFVVGATLPPLPNLRSDSTQE
jgi:hypothetical protein